MGASGLAVEGVQTHPSEQRGRRSGQSLADAVAFARGCAAALLFGEDGGVVAVSPPAATFPPGTMAALQRLLSAAPAEVAWTILLPRDTLVARRLGDRRILAGLLEPGADSAPVRGVLESLLPVTLAMLGEQAEVRSAALGATARLRPAVAEVPQKQEPLEPVNQDTPAGPPRRVPERRRRRWSYLAFLLAFALGMAIGAGLWAWSSGRPGFPGSALEVTTAPSGQPSATPEPSPAPPQTPIPTPIPTPSVPPNPPLQLTYGGDLAHGASGEAVRALQARLKQLRYFIYPEETGYFGDATYGAVYTFQRDRGLPSTGVLDQTTVNALNACDERCRY